MYLQLTLRNFKSFTNSTFVFDKHCTLISGQSGAGKTSIFVAIIFAFTGEGKKLVKHGKRSCSVKLTVDGVTITRSKGPVKLVVELEDGTVYEEMEAQNRIDVLFPNIHLGYVSQRVYGKSFLALSPSDKLRYIESIAFDKNFVDNINKKCKQLISSRKEMLGKTNKERTTMESMLRKMNIEKVDVNQHLDHDVEELKCQQEQLEKNVEIKKSIREKTKTQIDIKTRIEKELDEIPEVNETKQKLIEKIKSIQEHEAKWNQYHQMKIRFDALEEPYLTENEIEDLLRKNDTCMKSNSLENELHRINTKLNEIKILKSEQSQYQDLFNEPERRIEQLTYLFERMLAIENDANAFASGTDTMSAVETKLNNLKAIPIVDKSDLESYVILKKKLVDITIAEKMLAGINKKQLVYEGVEEPYLTENEIEALLTENIACMDTKPLEVKLQLVNNELDEIEILRKEKDTHQELFNETDERIEQLTYLLERMLTIENDAKAFVDASNEMTDKETKLKILKSTTIVDIADLERYAILKKKLVDISNAEKMLADITKKPLVYECTCPSCNVKLGLMHGKLVPKPAKSQGITLGKADEIQKQIGKLQAFIENKNTVLCEMKNLEDSYSQCDLSNTVKEKKRCEDVKRKIKQTEKELERMTLHVTTLSKAYNEYNKAKESIGIYYTQPLSKVSERMRKYKSFKKEWEQRTNRIPYLHSERVELTNSIMKQITKLQARIKNKDVVRAEMDEMENNHPLCNLSNTANEKKRCEDVKRKIEQAENELKRVSTRFSALSNAYDEYNKAKESIGLYYTQPLSIISDRMRKYKVFKKKWEEKTGRLSSMQNEKVELIKELEKVRETKLILKNAGYDPGRNTANKLKDMGKLLIEWNTLKDTCSTLECKMPTESSKPYEEMLRIHSTREEKIHLLKSVKTDTDYIEVTKELDLLQQNLLDITSELKTVEAYNHWKRVALVAEKEKELNESFPRAVKLQALVSNAERTALKETIDQINFYSQMYLDRFIDNLTVEMTFDSRINMIVKHNGFESDLTSLSGGEMARVVLAVTLAFVEMNGVDLIMLDESMASLDQETASSVIESIRELFKGTTLVIAHQTMEGIFDEVCSV